MSRLDSVIRRLEAQRRTLDWAAAEIAGRDGLVLELGLGNGRTYDHLRDRLPGRAIHVFERWPAAHPDCMPPAEFLVVGDLRETLPAFRARHGAGSAVLAHADIGSGDPAVDAELASALSALLPPLIAPGGIVLCDQSLDLPGFDDVAPRLGVPEKRYNAWVRRA
ncbi:class I SAM-dependent methyltransferase [Alsobacter sp. SYSU M60028]|uniref:Class I SAM-dependent methyltransferase n=1 Tax=Alsobacter ponti TaxID=2962936 RepID=A0ABT1LCL7_9HYPH|nr:class I SAM-dependent methyltransferase [Alsobacter ponti]